MALTASPFTPNMVMTVEGPLPYAKLGITDAHNHIWIDPVPGADPSAPVLDQFDAIVEELKEFRESGGQSLLDCQPDGCGRNGNQLLALSKASGIHIIACTGYHRKKYYPPNHWFWSLRAQKVTDFLCNEIKHGLFETLNSPSIVKAGFIKIALESSWLECSQAALEGTAAAAAKSHAMIEIHTEKGNLAEKICLYFLEKDVSPHQLVLCHMDKRPDHGLHKELARLGVLLEYDTFYRPKYEPETNLWPLIEMMVQAGLSENVALATDMAEAALYHTLGKGPGLASLPRDIQQQLIKRGIPEEARMQLLGGNIARRLAWN